MEYRRINIDQAETDTFLASLGIVMPRNEDELDRILGETDIETPELVDFRIDAEAIIKRTKEKEYQKPKLISAAKPKQIYKKQPNKAFKRIVLAAEITSQLHEEPTFGHIKLQKLIFLCENAIEFDFNFRYIKQAAGPYDNIFMHSIDPIFIKQKWFIINKESGRFGRVIYTPGEKFNTHKKYYEGYFKNDKKKIQQIIDVFRSQKSDDVELIATLFSCWIEMINKRQLVNDESLAEAVYGWSEEKKKYSEKEISDSIAWMRENHFYPR